MLLDLMLRLNRCVWGSTRVSAGLGVGLLVGALGGCVTESDRPEVVDLQDLIASHCAQVEACSCAGGTVASSCTEDLSDRWNTRIRGGEERGLTFDQECFDSIAPSIEGYRCGWIDREPSLCSSFCAVYYGTKTRGSACSGVDELVSDCVQGLVCHEGTCISPCEVVGGRQAGDFCADPGGNGGIYDSCASGLSCDYASGRCVARPQLGENCDTSECAPGLYCRYDETGASCVVAPGEGERCDDGRCAEGLDCEWQQNKTRVCMAEALVGQSCQNRGCADDLLCDQQDICVEPPTLGQPCLYNRCESGALCDWNSERCVAYPEAGERCVSGECQSNAWCLRGPDDPEGTCTERYPVGEMCSGHLQCASGFCPNGFCWPLAAEGEDCDGATPCGAGLVCNGAVCEAARGRGPAVCTYAGW